MKLFTSVLATLLLLGISPLNAEEPSLAWKVQPLTIDLNEGIDIADINGDGIHDLILGANTSDSINAEETGTVSVMFGNIFDRVPIPEESGGGQVSVFAIIGIVAVVIVIGAFWYLRRIRKAPTGA